MSVEAPLSTQQSVSRAGGRKNTPNRSASGEKIVVDGFDQLGSAFSMASPAPTPISAAVATISRDIRSRKRSRKIVHCSCFEITNLYVHTLKCSGRKLRAHFSFPSRQSFRRENARLLSRLTEPEREELESVLNAEVLSRRRRDYDSEERRRRIQAMYKPMQPSLFTLSESQHLSSDFVSIVAEAKTHKRLSKRVEVLALPDGGRAYAFPCLSRGFAALFLSEIASFKSTSAPRGKPNSMNNHGVLLHELGFTRAWTDPFMFDYICPLAELIFPGPGSALNAHRAFTVEYEKGKDEELSTHYDDAEVTLNVCLGKDFKGGDLIIYGRKRTAQHRLESKAPHAVRVPHVPGRAVLHLGSAMHRAEPIVSGTRVNLVLWMRNAMHRAANGCTFCGRFQGLKFVGGSPRTPPRGRGGAGDDKAQTS